MAVSLAKNLHRTRVLRATQEWVDERFVTIVGTLTPLGTLSERIVAAYGGWAE